MLLKDKKKIKIKKSWLHLKKTELVPCKLTLPIYYRHRIDKLAIASNKLNL